MKKTKKLQAELKKYKDYSIDVDVLDYLHKLLDEVRKDTEEYLKNRLEEAECELHLKFLLKGKPKDLQKKFRKTL